MNCKLILGLMLISSLGLSSILSLPTTSEDDNSKFGFALLDALEQQHGGVRASDNLVVSPLGVQTVLSMLNVGAVGQTAQQIQNALGKSSLLESAPKGNDYFQVANLFAAQYFWPVLNSFEDAMTSKFNTEVFSENFQTKSGATAELNAWLSNHTNGNISQFFQQDVNHFTKIVLLNSVHFVASWSDALPYFAEFTTKAPFELSNGGVKQVDMMQTLGYLRYAQFDDGELIEFPFRDQGLFMYCFLPDEQLIAKAVSFSALFSSMPLSKRLAQLNDGIYTFLYFPRFGMTQNASTSFSIRQPLKQLGITDAFIQETADFHGIDGKRDLYVYDMLHQISINWNEVTTKADSGAGSQQDRLTGMGAGGGIMPTPASINLTFNRTFLYFIRNNNTAQPVTLFAGVAHSP